MDPLMRTLSYVLAFGSGAVVALFWVMFLLRSKKKAKK